VRPGHGSRPRGPFDPSDQAADSGRARGRARLPALRDPAAVGFTVLSLVARHRPFPDQGQVGDGR
jgi:hypothetical protein